MAPNTRVGTNKGFKTTPNTTKIARPSRMRDRPVNKHVKFVREVVKDIMGNAPYERRALELLRISRDKRCLKFLKRRLGSHTRAKRKRDEMQRALAASRKHHGK